MGVGKSTIGKKLARLLNYDFVDTDALFEEKYRLSINDFFSKYNEKLFREFENKILQSTFNLQNAVIATGGGTPCYFNAMDKINKYGKSVYLEMPLTAIVNRLENSIKPRPLVDGKSHKELLSIIGNLLEQRLEYYKMASMSYPATGINVSELARLLGSAENPILR
jgi:shikimate kinase